MIRHQKYHHRRSTKEVIKKPRMAMFLDAILDLLKNQTQRNLIDGCNGFRGPKNICLDTRINILA